MASEATKGAYLTLGLLGESRPDEAVRAILLDAIEKMAAIPPGGSNGDAAKPRNGKAVSEAPELTKLREEIVQAHRSGVSYQEIADDAGMPRTTLSGFVSGKTIRSKNQDLLRLWLDTRNEETHP